MLKFTPEHQLTLTATPDNKMTATLTISNPSARPAPFKVKSTRPSIFTIEPPSGMLLPHQQVRVHITTRLANTPELAHQISYHNKFMIEYALLERIPESVVEGLRLISEENRQEHRLFISSSATRLDDRHEVHSGISNRYSYRTVHEDDDIQVASGGRARPDQNYEVMNAEQKFQHLTREIDRLQKEKSELIMTSRPKHVPNLLRMLIVIIIGLVVGNLIGRGVGLKSKIDVPKEVHVQQGWVDKAKGYWNKAWKKTQEKIQPKPWWKFWN